jgi:hypothetical protein
MRKNGLRIHMKELDNMKLSQRLALITLALVPPLSAQAQAPDSDTELDYVVEYGAAIADADRVSSAGTQLSDPRAILRQDRYNVDVVGVSQPGDSSDPYFTSKGHRAEIAKASVLFLDDFARDNLMTGAAALFVTVKRDKGGNLVFFLATSDGEPADPPEE